MPAQRGAEPGLTQRARPCAALAGGDIGRGNSAKPLQCLGGALGSARLSLRVRPEQHPRGTRFVPGKATGRTSTLLAPNGLYRQGAQKRHLCSLLLPLAVHCNLFFSPAEKKHLSPMPSRQHYTRCDHTDGFRMCPDLSQVFCPGPDLCPHTAACSGSSRCRVSGWLSLCLLGQEQCSSSPDT